MTDHYDVVVVGGGIQGVGVAQAAAAEGFSVLVIEKSGLADGTSSKSSKLIHGGLRYLEGWHFSLVRECLREQSILLKIAPDLVQLRQFLIPVYEQTRRSSLYVKAGLHLYHALANFRPQAKPGSISRENWMQLDGLNTDGLKSVLTYTDAQTDDRLLTEAVMNSAESLGAELLVPATFLSANIHAEGVDIQYSMGAAQHSCRADVLVNAGGPWVNNIASKIIPTPRKQDVDLVAGTHIVLDAQMSDRIYYTESPRDGRAVFVMPWKGKTLVGTTERIHRDLPDLVKPSLSEKTYLLSILKHYFPAYENFGVQDIQDSFSGLRVLPRDMTPGHKSHAFHRSREVIYVADHDKAPKVISIYGGKLTAYRATAQEVMKRIREALPSRKRYGYTENLRLRSPDSF